MSNQATGGRPPRRRAKMAAVLIAVFTVGALGGGALVTSSDAWSHLGRWGGMKGHHGGPEMWKEHARMRAGFLLDGVDATEEQRAAIDEIIGQASEDFAGAFGEHRSMRREWFAELERPELDPEAMETLRAKHLEMVDEKSRRMLDTVLRIGAVLTAEQRAELVSKFSRHRKWHRERRGGREEG